MTKKPSKPYRLLATKLPRPILADIGDVIVRWGTIEYQLHRLLCACYSLSNETGRALTVGMDIGVSCGLLRTAAKSSHWISDKSVREELKALAETVGKEKDRRHDLAHGFFGFDMDSPNSFARYRIRSADERVTPVAEPVDRKQLKQWSDTAREIGDSILDLTVRVKALQKRSP